MRILEHWPVFPQIVMTPDVEEVPKLSGTRSGIVSNQSAPDMTQLRLRIPVALRNPSRSDGRWS